MENFIGNLLDFWQFRISYPQANKLNVEKSRQLRDFVKTTQLSVFNVYYKIVQS